MLVLTGEKARVELVRFSPDGRGIAVPFFSGVRFWKDLQNPTAYEDYDARGTHMQFAPDGMKLYTQGRPLFVHDLVSGESHELAGWHRYAVLTLTPDGTHFLHFQHRGGSPAYRVLLQSVDDPSAVVWACDIERDVLADPAFVAGDRFILTEFWYDYDRRCSCSRDTLRALHTGEVLAERVGAEPWWSGYAVSADGLLFAGTRMAKIVVYSVNEFANPIITLANTNKKHFTGIAFHPSGRYLAATSNDTTVKLYDTTTWEVAKTFTWKIGRMRSIAFSPDGTLAAAGSDKGQVVVWDVDL